MQLTRVRIYNFRSIKELTVELGDTTVFIGGNDAGKSAIVDAIRIVLTRRWGRRGTGFTETDVHREADEDVRTAPAVRIEIDLEEASAGEWDPDLVSNLEDIMTLLPDGRNAIILRVTSAWDPDIEDFSPKWEFLDPNKQPLTGKSQRAINLTGFFGYLPVFWLGALRDADDEFAPRSTYWGKLLRGTRIPKELEEETLKTLAELDRKIIAADPNLAKIAEVIGQATHIAIRDMPGAARLSTLPLTMDEMLQRASVILQSETGRPWLPLDHHGQGLQSLAVLFLFQAAVIQRLKESGQPGLEAIFAIEEPEVHLHPQAARTLWPRIQALPGQRLATTHSPYFVQNVPLHDLRMVYLQSGCTTVAALPKRILSPLPWTTSVETLCKTKAKGVLVQDPVSKCVAAVGSLDPNLLQSLERCYRKDSDPAARKSEAAMLRRNSRILVSDQEERELAFHGRRIRGEVFFARRWVLVEGACEYLLLNAIADALSWPLDAHGVTVIDFQNSGSPGIYVALAEALHIPWHMITDGDAAASGFRKQILNRGFTDADLVNKLTTLTAPNDLEAELIAEGHDALLRKALAESEGATVNALSPQDFVARLRNRKTLYMGTFADYVARDATLAAKMPTPFVQLITRLRDGSI